MLWFPSMVRRHFAIVLALRQVIEWLQFVQMSIFLTAAVYRQTVSLYNSSQRINFINVNEDSTTGKGKPSEDINGQQSSTNNCPDTKTHETKKTFELQNAKKQLNMGSQGHQVIL